ncbi:MAG: D-alanyl-D-alanine carboxypeptidase family protein, partial [Acutalibacteraceae bacterium]
MSEHFNGKDYGDYFESLERRLNRAEKPETPPDASAEPERQVRARKKRGIYKVIKLRKAVCALVLVAAVISATAVIVSHSGKYKAETSQDISGAESLAATEKSEDTVEKIVYQITDQTKEIPADNDCEGAIVIRTATHTAVAARNPHKRLYPASTTKLMTLLVACENIKNYDDTFTMTLQITDPLFVAEASVAGFLSGEVISMTDLLYGLILPSGADAAVALTQKISGSEAEFVKLMNKKAEELGLEDTHFANATGLFDKEQYTTAYDMAIILETALKYPICKK